MVEFRLSSGAASCWRVRCGCRNDYAAGCIPNRCALGPVGFWADFRQGFAPGGIPHASLRRRPLLPRAAYYWRHLRTRRIQGNDTLQTGFALQFYSLGLVSYACIKVLSPAFYAIDKKWTPMFVSFAAIGLNFCLNYLFIFQIGVGPQGVGAGNLDFGRGKFSDAVSADAS